MKVYALCNQKGGVGKTTSSINIAYELARLGNRVLLVDMDPQANGGSGLGLNKYHVEKSIYHTIIGETPLNEIIRSSEFKNLDIAPSNRDLVGAELELVSAFSRETKLKKALATVADNYDFVIIDCPPSLNLLTVNALTAADEVLIPVQCEYYALEGISELIHTIELLKDNLNPELVIGGIILTMFDARNNLSHQVADEIRNHFKDKGFQTVIPRSVKLSESPSHGMPIYSYEPKSKGAVAYHQLAEEILHRSKLTQKGGLTLVHNQ